MEQVSIADFEINYGRMSRVDESIFDEPKGPGLNMAAFLGAIYDDVSDLVWKLSDQHDKVWSFDYGGRKLRVQKQTRVSKTMSFVKIGYHNENLLLSI